MMKDHGDGSDERRKKKDILVRLLGGLNLASWGLVIIFLILTERAKPQFETFFDRFYNLDIRTRWDSGSAELLLNLAMTGAVLSALGLCLSLFRARRKTDGNRMALLVMGIFSILGILGLKLFVLRSG